MDGTTQMHSHSEVLLAEFDQATQAGHAFVGGGEAYDALVLHVWGRNPTPVEWRQWISIMRAAGRDDVCYRDHPHGVDGPAWRDPLGND